MRLDKVDWNAISTESGPLPDGDYRCEIESVTEGKSETLPQKDTIKFEHLVIEPQEHAGRKLFDFLTMQTNKGEVNKMSYGRVKAYAAATVGEDRLAADDFDTAELKGQTCVITVEIDSYEKEMADGSKKSVPVNRIKRISRA